MVKPSDINIKKSSTNTPVKTHRQRGGADRFLITAKELTVKNYNDHRPEGSPEISYDEVYIVWFSKTINNWKALCATSNSDDLYYEITHNGYRSETYCDVYKKIGKATYADPTSAKKAPRKENK